MAPATPQLEDGFTRIANELFEAVIGFGFSQRQLAVLLAVLRKTYGYGKKEDDMSASQIGELCKLPRNHVTAALNKLAEMNVISKRPGRYGSIVGLNKIYTTWIDPDSLSGKAKKSGVSTLAAVGDKRYHYVYRITDEKTSQFYIGVRSCDCLPAQDRYMGSGNWLASANKADFRKEVLECFESRLEAEVGEVRYIQSANGGIQNVRLYKASTHSVSPRTDSVPPRTELVLVQNLSSPSTDSVQVDRTDSVHTKENLPKENQQKKARARSSRPEVCFADWMESVKAEGKKPIPEDHAVFAYADKISLPIEYVRLCWLEFKRLFADNRKKKYIDWPGAFANYVRKNYFRLWFEKDGQWLLTTAGVQLQKEMKGE